MLRSDFVVGLPTYNLMLTGVGLGSGLRSKTLVKPGYPHSGVIFYRQDAFARNGVPARLDYVSSMVHATSLAFGASEVGGVEHFLAAVYIAGVWDLEVRVAGPELPGVDGSALPWLEGMKREGLFRSVPPARALTLREKVEIRREGWWAVLEPAESPTLTMSASFGHPGLGEQRITVDLEQEALLRELAPARTFGFLNEEGPMSAEGLIQRNDPRRAVIYDHEGKVVNEEGARFADEPVRHKALDFIGDLALLGAPVLARITCHNTSHAAHKQILIALRQQEALEEITL